MIHALPHRSPGYLANLFARRDQLVARAAVAAEELNAAHASLRALQVVIAEVTEGAPDPSLFINGRWQTLTPSGWVDDDRQSIPA